MTTKSCWVFPPWLNLDSAVPWWSDGDILSLKSLRLHLDLAHVKKKQIKYLTATTKKQEKMWFFQKHLTKINPVTPNNIYLHKSALDWSFGCKKFLSGAPPNHQKMTKSPPKVPYKTPLLIRVCYMWKMFSVTPIKFYHKKNDLPPVFFGRSEAPTGDPFEPTPRNI